MSAGGKPGWLLATNSCVLIGASSILAGAGGGLLALTWDPCAMITGVVMIGTFAPLACAQYLGVFRGRVAAAVWSARLLLLFGFFTGLGDAMFFGEALLDRSLNRSLAPALLLIGAFALWLVAMSRSMTRWARRVAEEGRIEGPRAKQFTSRELLGAVAAISLVAVGAVGMYRDSTPRYARHVAPDEAPLQLPREASDVNYCRGIASTLICDFAIDEAAFRTWAESWGVDGKRFAEIDEPKFVAAAENWIGQTTYPQIDDGLTFEGAAPGIFIYYDRRKGRAYFERGRD